MIFVKIGLTMTLGGFILLVIFLLLFDEGGNQTSPKFKYKWMEYIFDFLIGVIFAPVLIAMAMVVYGIFYWIWSL